MKIAIPQNSIYDLILKNADEVCKMNNIELIKVKSNRVGDLFRKRLVDIALLNPLDYFKGTGKGDYRILPSTCLAVEGYSSIISLKFNPNLRTISSSAYNFDDEYLQSVCKIILAERYDLEINMEFNNNSIDVLLNSFDSVIRENEFIENSISLTEDWFLSFEEPLPLAYWVGFNEEFEESAINMVSSFADETIINGKKDIILPDSDSERTGAFLTKWNSRHKSALEKTADMFYYYGFINEISDINLAEFE